MRINFSTSLLTNVSPSNIIKNSKLRLKYNSPRKTGKIYSRNLLVFLFLLGSAGKKNIMNFCVFVKPKRVKKYTILRAPYRYKGARIHIMYNRYFIIVRGSVESKTKPLFKTIAQLADFTQLVQEIPNWFDTSILKQHRTKVWYSSIFTPNFLVKNFI